MHLSHVHIFLILATVASGDVLASSEASGLSSREVLPADQPTVHPANMAVRAFPIRGPSPTFLAKMGLAIVGGAAAGGTIFTIQHLCKVFTCFAFSTPEHHREMHEEVGGSEF